MSTKPNNAKQGFIHFYEGIYYNYFYNHFELASSRRRVVKYP